MSADSAPVVSYLTDLAEWIERERNKLARSNPMQEARWFALNDVLDEIAHSVPAVKAGTDDLLDVAWKLLAAGTGDASWCAARDAWGQRYGLNEPARGGPNRLVAIEAMRRGREAGDPS